MRTRNLAGIDARFPLGEWTAVCGVSGSGKTSLVFDTLHAEAERRWLSTLPSWRRNLADALPRPSMDAAVGLVPTAADAGHWTTLAGLAGLQEPLVALWAAASTPVSPFSGQPMEAVSAPEVAARCLRDASGEKVQVLFAPDDPTPGAWVRRGFVRGIVRGESVELEALDASVEVEGLRIVVDRLRVEERQRLRLSEAVLSAYRLGRDLCSLELGEPGTTRTLSFSGVPRCLTTGRTAPKASPALFSRRSARGACPACKGAGAVEGAGTGEGSVCPACAGSGLREEAGWFRIGGISLVEWMACEVDAVREIAGSGRWTELAQGPCAELVEEIRRRLEVLSTLGLGYLPLGRAAASLSQGEERRSRLAGLVGAPLAGLAYVLDEPTTGLHPQDLPKVHALLRDLRTQGATLVVVEHDLRSLHRCDRVLETGPGPGPAGGRLVFNGLPSDLPKADTPSGRWLSGSARPPRRMPAAPRGRVVLGGACGRYLREVRLEVALGAFNAVSGVSGSGKSTLVLDTLAPALRQKLSGRGMALPFASIAVEGDLHEVAVVEPGGDWIGSPRSTVATLSGMLDDLRSLYAALPDAKLQGWTASRFSPNVRGGRCEVCEGIGEERIELHLLPDAWVPCSRCQGARFDEQTLSVRWKGLSLADVLAMDLEAARPLFSNHPRLGALVQRLCEAGLGHLSGGRRCDSLSGGEALRLRLASGVGVNARKRILWILDEPSRGLHPLDTVRLMTLFDQLVGAGDTVLAISHDPVLLARADRVNELGPGAGAAGGNLLYAGDPAGLAVGQFPSSESVRREREA